MSCYFKKERPIWAKLILKVFGRGYGGEPFLRKVSPDKKYKLPYMHHGIFFQLS